MTQRTRSANLGGTVVTSTGVVLASGLDVSSQSNAAYQQANTARNTANSAFNHANSAFAHANTIFDQANAAYLQANTARSDANTTFATVNITFGTVNTAITNAHNQANSARSDANTTFATVNSTFSSINSTFGTVNTAVTNAHNQANSAFAAANLRLSTSGGSISGDLAITGNLTVQGNATTINVSNLSVNDSMILLSTNAVGDSNDIGFIGHFDRGATATHAGLIRKATQNQFYLFDNYEVEPSNNVIDVTGNNFRVGNLRLGIINANSFVTSAGLDVTGQANAAFAAANNRVLKAGDTMTGSLVLGAGRTVGNGGVFLSHTGLNTDVFANGRTASVSTGWGTFRIHQEAGNPGLIIAGDAGQTAPYFRIQNNAESALLIVDSSGNFGLNMTPGRKFDVNGGGRFVQDTAATTGAITLRQNSGDTVPAYIQWVNNAANSERGWMTMDTSSNFILATASAEKLRVTSSGNVGINVTSPGHKLEVSGSLYHRDAYASVGGYNSGGANTPFNRYGPTFGTNITNGQAEVNIWNPTDPATYTSTGILFSQALSNTTRRDLMFLKHDGLVGIGTNSPNSPLHIVTTNNVAPILRMETTGNSTNTAFWIEDQDANPAAKAIATMDLSAGLGLFNLYAGAYTLGATNYYASTRGASRIGMHDNAINFYTANASSAGHSTGTAVTWYQTLNMSNTDFIIYTNNGTERARVNSAGNFGIGTSSPAYRLDVDSTSGVRFKVATGGYNWINLVSGYTGQLSIGLNDSGGSGALGVYQYNSSGSFVRIALSLDSAGSLTSSTDMRAPIFYDSNDTSGYFDGAGALVMRGGSPTIYFRDTDHNSAMLHCNGNLLYVLRGGNDTTSWSAVNGQWPFYFVLSDNNALCGGSFSAIGNVTAYASDRRLKTNIQKIPNALDKVLSLNGVTFDWIDRVKEIGFKPDTMINDAGIIAQEVQEVLPQAVKPAPFDYQWDINKNDYASKSGEGFITVQYEKIVPLLIEAIKELKAEIDTLKQRG